jgi:Fe-Mn family superoxide dismutase
LQKASTVFGSGWVYLSKDPSGGLVIKQYANALNPIKDGGIPLLTVDAWEHNWYIDYENRKGEFFEKFFDHVNWSFVESRFKAAGLI